MEAPRRAQMRFKAGSVAFFDAAKKAGHSGIMAAMMQ